MYSFPLEFYTFSTSFSAVIHISFKALPKVPIFLTADITGDFLGDWGAERDVDLFLMGDPSLADWRADRLADWRADRLADWRADRLVAEGEPPPRLLLAPLRRLITFATTCMHVYT